MLLPNFLPAIFYKLRASFLSILHAVCDCGTIASADKGTHGFSRGKTTSGVVILVDGRQPIFLVCLASRRLSSVKNSEGLAGRSGALSARQRTQACWRNSRTITRQTAVQAGPQACVPLSTDASNPEYTEKRDFVTNPLISEALRAILA